MNDMNLKLLNIVETELGSYHFGKLCHSAPELKDLVIKAVYAYNPRDDRAVLVNKVLNRIDHLPLNDEQFDEAEKAIVRILQKWVNSKKTHFRISRAIDLR